MRAGIMRRLAFYLGWVVAFAPPLMAQGYKIQWVCDPKATTKRFYRRDIGVVCWEGKTYRKTDPGGIPQYMLDYFDQVRENVRRAVGDTRRTKVTRQTETPSRIAATETQTAGPPVPAVRQAPASSSVKPLDPALLSSVESGMPRSKLREKLGEPGSALTITGSHEVLEIWSYALTDGRTAKFRIRNGVLASYQIEGQKRTSSEPRIPKS